jgi:YgiT-type zinc finger domain-containing protein
MIKITICPTCGSDKIKKVRRNWTGKAQDKTYSVPNLEYYECPNCGEKVYDREAMRKIEAHSPVFSKKHAKKAA